MRWLRQLMLCCHDYFRRYAIDFDFIFFAAFRRLLPCQAFLPLIDSFSFRFDIFDYC
jgi:hypothetical protein